MLTKTPALRVGEGFEGEQTALGKPLLVVVLERSFRYAGPDKRTSETRRTRREEPMGRWLLGLLLAGAALGIAENRTSFMRKGIQHARERHPKDRIKDHIKLFRETRQPWWKIS